MTENKVLGDTLTGVRITSRVEEQRNGERERGRDYHRAAKRKDSLNRFSSYLNVSDDYLPR